MTTILLGLLLTACPDRACLVGAAKTCTANSGTLAFADWFDQSLGTVKGTTAVVIQKGPGAACTVTLTAHVTEAPQGRAAKMNADVRSSLVCEGPPAQLAKLVEALGTSGLKAPDLMMCAPTRCEALPPLLQGCTAGPCVRGTYAVSCAGVPCQMAGLTKDELPPGMGYGCGPDHAIVMKPLPKKK